MTPFRPLLVLTFFAVSACVPVGLPGLGGTERPMPGCVDDCPSHGPYSASTMTLVTDGQTASFSDGSAGTFAVDGHSYLTISARRAIGPNPTSSWAGVRDLEFLSIMVTDPPAWPGTARAELKWERFDSDGKRTSLLSDSQATVTIDRYRREGTGPWGDVMTLSGTVVGSDSGARAAYAVTFTATPSRR